MMCKCHALAFLPQSSAAVAGGYLGMTQLPELRQVNFITRNRGVGCPVYDRMPSATALYGNSIETMP